MQKPFQPSPDARVATIDMEGLGWLALKLEVIDFVNRMIRIDSVYLDFATDQLSVSFYFPCTESAIRSRLMKAGYGVKEKEAPVLTIEAGELPEAISA